MQLGPYTIGEELGRGAVGRVHRAHAPDGRVVALKLLHRAALEDLERFDRERSVHGSLGVEDGFVPLLGSGEAGGVPYLVMPLVAGGTLRQRLRRGPVAVEEAVALGRALAAALAAAHAKGIVHRDLKPENVLFDAGRPLIADLGLAKHFGREIGDSVAVLTRTGELKGTAGYMAPEQIADSRSAGPAADVFAWGAILHECLAGAPAFSGVSPVEVLARTCAAAPPPIADAPAWLAALIARTLEKDPRRRPADGAALLAALEGRAAPRPRGALPIAVAAVGVVALVVGLAIFGPKRSPDPTPRPTEALRDAVLRHERDREAGLERARDAASSLGRVVATGALVKIGEEAATTREWSRAASAWALAADLDGGAALERLAAAAAAIASSDVVSLAAIPPLPRLPALNQAASALFRERAIAAWREEHRALWELSARALLSQGDPRDVEPLLLKIDRVLEALGRSLEADPAADPFPDALGPFFSYGRVLGRTRIFTAEAVRTASRRIPEHPLARVLEVQLLRRAPERDGHAAILEHARRAIPSLEAAQSDVHARLLAHELVAALTHRSAETLEVAEKLARISGFLDSSEAVHSLRTRLGGPDRPRPEGPKIPDRLRDAEYFLSAIEFAPEPEEPALSEALVLATDLEARLLFLDATSSRESLRALAPVVEFIARARAMRPELAAIPGALEPFFTVLRRRSMGTSLTTPALLPELRPDWRRAFKAMPDHPLLACVILRSHQLERREPPELVGLARRAIAELERMPALVEARVLADEMAKSLARLDRRAPDLAPVLTRLTELADFGETWTRLASWRDAGRDRAGAAAARARQRTAAPIPAAYKNRF